MTDKPTRSFLRPLTKGLLMLGCLAGAGLLARALGLDQAFDQHWVDSTVRGRGALGWLILGGAGALFMAVGLPRQIVAFLAGYAYGFVNGAVLTTAALALGCGLCFWYARFFGRGFTARRFGRRIKRVDDFLRRNPFTMTLVIRLLPVGSNLATNLLAGVSAVGAWPFLTATALGSIPQTLVFALLGSGFQVETSWRVALSMILFVVSSALGLHLFWRFRAAAAIADGENGGDNGGGNGADQDPGPTP